VLIEGVPDNNPAIIVFFLTGCLSSNSYIMQPVAELVTASQLLSNLHLLLKKNLTCVNGGNFEGSFSWKIMISLYLPFFKKTIQ